MRLLFLLSLVCFGNLCFAQIPVQRLSEDLNGKVKSINISRYKAVDSAGVAVRSELKDGSYIIEKQYDTTGIMVVYRSLNVASNFKKEQYYDERGKLKRTVETKDGVKRKEAIHYRNPEGNNIRSLTIEGEDTTRTDFIYNEDGKLTDAIDYNSKGEVENHFTHAYDKAGNRVGYTLTYQDKVVFNRRTVYDADSNLVEMCDLDETGSPSSCIFRKYNDLGRVIEDIEQKNGVLTRIMHFEYDEEGSRTSEKIFDEFMNLKEWNQYAYENGKQTMIKEMDGDGKISRHEVLLYDESGNHIRTEYYSFEEGKLLFAHDWKYEFDEKGNWIKKIMYMSNRPYYITEREISYYE